MLLNFNLGLVMRIKIKTYPPTIEYLGQNLKKFLGFTNLPLLSNDIDEDKTQVLDPKN